MLTEAMKARVRERLQEDDVADSYDDGYPACIAG
jgi:hypothetical protein